MEAMTRDNGNALEAATDGLVDAVVNYLATSATVTPGGAVYVNGRLMGYVTKAHDERYPNRCAWDAGSLGTPENRDGQMVRMRTKRDAVRAVVRFDVEAGLR